MVKVNSYAKLNLSLDILGKREDGYHLLDMVMLSVSLSDTIEFRQNSSLKIEIVSNSSSIPLDESNLIFKAAKALADYCHVKEYGLKISIDKNIPTEAGLGGGSANAASTLIALRKLWELNVTDDELAEIGLKIGADVPFCLQGGIARVKGIGEEIYRISAFLDCYFVIVLPSGGISTKTAFRQIDEKSCYARPSTDNLVLAIEEKSISNVASLLCNVFETSGVSTSSKEPIELLIENKALGASLTGTGSAVFGIFRNEKEAKNCVANIKNRYTCWIATPYNSGTDFY